MNEREIFEQAIGIHDINQRNSFLNQACGGDTALRNRLNELLASHDQASGFLKVPVVDQLPPVKDSRHHPTIALPQTGRATDAEASQHGSDDEAPGAADLSFLQPSASAGSIGRLAHYEILQVLGQGAFGIVFKAFDEKLHRLVAIKAMNPQLAATSPPRKRFLREARSVAAIKHENIVQVHSVEEQPLPYLVMEYVDGQTLQQKMDGSGPLELGEILSLGRQVAAGLAAAHDKGLIHRDIKPGNILLEAGVEPKVKITDFGLARAADDATMTRTGMIAGTPMYMAPEQAMGQDLDHRADLFSLGSVLYQMACGRAPFRGPNAVAVLKRVVDETPRPIRQILQDVPSWLCAIIEKLHAKKPDERYQSAKEVADLLARCQANLQHNGRIELPGDHAAFLSKPVEGTKQELAMTDNVPEKPVALPPTGAWLRWIAAAVLVLMLLVGVIFTESTGITNVRGTMIRLFSSDGTRVEEVEDMVITGIGEREIRRKPGQVQPTVGTDPDRRAAEYILSIPRDHVVTIQVNDVDRWIGNASDLPTGPFRLTGVFVEWASKLDDEGLANFQGCKHVKILRLWGTQATQKGLVHFKDCPDLYELSLNGNLITDSALEIFKGRKLTSFHVQSNKVTDAGLAHFQGSQKLTSLAIAGSPITDDALAYFQANKGLKQLTLVDTRITDAGLAHFRGCQDLEVLELFWNRLSDVGLVHFQGCKKLNKIDLGRLALVTDTGLGYFKDCLQLEHLALSGTSVSDDGLAHLKNLKNLTFLRLDSTKVTDAGIAHLEPCQLLSELHLWQTRVTGTGFVHLKELPNLSRLFLAECPVTDDSVGALSECVKLRTLGLTKTGMSAEGVKKLSAALPQCQIESDHGKFGPGQAR